MTSWRALVSGVAIGLIAACGHPAADAVDAAGTADVASADAPSGDGASACPYAYCEDFESYPEGSLADGGRLGPWAVAVSAVTISIDTTHAYKSGKALHITMPALVNSHTGGTPTHGVLSQTAAAGIVPSNDVYGRAMIYYSNTGGNDLPLGVHSWFFRSGGTSSQLAAASSINLGGGGAKLQLNYSPGDLSVQGGAVTAGAWHCVQWQFDGSGSPPKDVAKVWIDGTLAISIPVSQGWKFPTPWTAIDFGFTHYQTLNNPVDVTLDSFALDGTMIPCP